ncbi:hypothetical protein CISIN_1g028704mg [Citrus sinensis]|uniref:Remorin N-terminal domain-containing protein n=1 Tax=Citrus sinensis TaxID=2711 RepID=A0A067H280_CITSI|nr:hypothetical protein CISIN_1g028704mg [Citrus sinensis]
MAEEQVKKVEAETPAAPAPAPALAPAPAPAVPNNDVAEEKAVTQLHDQEKPVDDSKALAVVDQTPDSAKKKISGEKKISGSHDRDVALAEVEKEKRESFIKAWEESEKTKAENKAQKKLSAVAAWENSKKASLEAKLKKIEVT